MVGMDQVESRSRFNDSDPDAQAQAALEAQTAALTLEPPVDLGDGEILNIPQVDYTVFEKPPILLENGLRCTAYVESATYPHKVVIQPSKAHLDSLERILRDIYHELYDRYPPPEVLREQLRNHTSASDYAPAMFAIYSQRKRRWVRATYNRDPNGVVLNEVAFCLVDYCCSETLPIDRIRVLPGSLGQIPPLGFLVTVLPARFGLLLTDGFKPNVWRAPKEVVPKFRELVLGKTVGIVVIRACSVSPVKPHISWYVEMRPLGPNGEMDPKIIPWNPFNEQASRELIRELEERGPGQRVQRVLPQEDPGLLMQLAFINNFGGGGAPRAVGRGRGRVMRMPDIR